MVVKDYTIPNKKDYVLDEDQNEIVEKLLENDCFFNCSQTGIGKTLATLTAALHKKKEIPEAQFVIIVPNSATKAFVDTLDNILDEPYSLLTANRFDDRKSVTFHIFNYSTLSTNITNINKNDIRTLNKYISFLYELRKSNENLYLILDEAHALQSPKTNQYKVIYAIRSWFKGIWALTATPILNDLDGLYYMTNLVIPGYFKSIWSFKGKYQVMQERKQWVRQKNGKAKQKSFLEVIGYKNLDLLKEAFNKISVIRAKIYDIELIYKSTKLDEGSIEFYRKASKGLFSGTQEEKQEKREKSKKKEKRHWGARLHDLQRVVSNSHKDFKWIKDKDHLTEKEILLLYTILEVIKKNEAMLIYFSYLETVERVKTLLNKVREPLGLGSIYEITGNISQVERREVESAIRPKDIVLITSAGTESINLQKANNIIFYEIPFSLREFVQACGRITRTNSKYEKFYVYILEAEGTIDTYKKNRVSKNALPLQIVIGGSGTLPTELLELSNRDIQDMKDEYLWLK